MGEVYKPFAQKFENLVYADVGCWFIAAIFEFVYHLLQLTFNTALMSLESLIQFTVIVLTHVAQ